MQSQTATQAPHLKLRRWVEGREGIEYEIEGPLASLILTIAPDAAGWRIDARASHTHDTVVVTASAATRACALEEVARWWQRQMRILMLPRIDWPSVAAVLISANVV